MKYYEDVISGSKKEEYILFMRDRTVQKIWVLLKTDYYTANMYCFPGIIANL